MTFINAARALPVLNTIKDDLAVKWNEAFVQAPNTCKTSQHVASCTHAHMHTDTHTQTSLGKYGQIKDGKHLLHLCNFIRGACKRQKQVGVCQKKKETRER